MKKVVKICEFGKCMGCGVCADACPQKCISFKCDENGFYRSYVNADVCIRCQRCVNVCPANHSEREFRIQRAYKARRVDREASIQSSSGGIASVLSEYIVKTGGIVAGCGFDEELCLKHSFATSLDEIKNFKGSKYLQSYTPGIYCQVREQLQAGKKVLFIGTPCQIGALKNFLGKKYCNLYTVDFVCHGVSSRYVFDKYLKYLNPSMNPVSVKFRNKIHGYRNKKACFEMQVEYPEQIFYSSTESGIYYWFASSLSIRESCYNCPFVSAERASDVTLADYKGNDLDELDNKIGVNTLFVNSDKGMTLINSVKQEIVLELKKVEDVIKQYDRLQFRTYKPLCRKAFFDDLFVYDYPTLVKRYDKEKVLPNIMIRRYYAMKRRIQKILLKRYKINE